MPQASRPMVRRLPAPDSSDMCIGKDAGFWKDTAGALCRELCVQLSETALKTKQAFRPPLPSDYPLLDSRLSAAALGTWLAALEVLKAQSGTRRAKRGRICESANECE